MATTVLKAEQYSVVNIKWKWDTDGDEELFDSLPEEIVLPLQFASAAEGEDYLDDISEWISDKYGYGKIHSRVYEEIRTIVEEREDNTEEYDIEWEDDSREDDDLEYADAWDKNDNGIPDYAEDDR